MTWPWVSRTKLQHVQRLLTELYERLRDREGRISELRTALEHAEKERKELTYQMLRLTQGLPLFPEQVKAEAPQIPAEPAFNFEAAGEDEVNRHLAGLAIARGLKTMPQIHRFVEQQKARMYADRVPRAAEPEADGQAKAVASMLEAMAEGREAAGVR